MLHSHNGFASKIPDAFLFRNPPPPAGPCTSHQPVADSVTSSPNDRGLSCIAFATKSFVDLVQPCLVASDFFIGGCLVAV